MPLTVSVSVSQNAGLPGRFVVTDTSTGSDPSITTRRVYAYIADNTTLVPDGTSTPYVSWPIADGPLSMDVLSRDYAVMLVVQWLDGSNNVIYSLTNYYVFTAYTKQFLYELTTDQASNPPIIQVTDWFSNKALMWTCVDDAENAIALGEDVKKAQLALDIAYNMIVNQDKYF